VFEPTPLNIKKSKLSNNFHFSSLSTVDRLTDILMHDFNLIDSYTKQLALSLIKNLQPNHISIKAFESSKIINLRVEAFSLNEKVSKQTLQQLDFSKTICNYFLLDNSCESIFQRWIFTDNKLSVNKGPIADKLSIIYNSKLQSIGISNLLECDFKLDLVAIILLNRLNQDTDYLWREAVA